MVRTQEELIKQIKDLLGDNDSDEALSLLEDVSDTYKDFEDKTSDKEDWKTKYEENDKAWRTKYKERFSQPIESKDDSDDDDSDDDSNDKPLTFENLFTEGK